MKTYEFKIDKNHKCKFNFLDILLTVPILL